MGNKVVSVIACILIVIVVFSILACTNIRSYEGGELNQMQQAVDAGVAEWTMSYGEPVIEYIKVEKEKEE